MYNIFITAVIRTLFLISEVNMKQTINSGTILILDIGKNTAQPDEKNARSFFEQVKECASRIIERKIITQDKTYLGIILMGSNKTKNTMASESPGVFKYIEVMSELAVPTWQLIDDLPTEPGYKKGDWFDALIVAADHFKNGVYDTKILSKKIILMSNFKNPSYMEPSDIENALVGLQEDEFEVDVIGPDLDSDLNKIENIDTIKKIIEQTNGVSATFEYAMNYLTFHKKKAINAKPWNADLSIGPNIRIPVSAYIRIKDEPAIKKWTTSIKDPVSLESSKTEGIVREKVHVKNDDQSVVENHNVIKGYHYGQKIIPFADCDKKLLYESGDKCLSVYGFTNSDNIKWENLNGDGLYYVFGRKGDSKAQLAIRCLVECLHELKLVGIVRKVYNKGNAPKMYALMPVIDTNNYVCLSLINICYKEEYKFMSFPPTNLKKYSCTVEQVNAFKELINAMDLTKAYDDSYDDSEAFPIGEAVSPAIQYVYDCIVHRAMNPDKQLPQPRDEIIALFKIPPLIEKRVKEPINKLKQLFTLTKVEKKTRKHKLPEEDVFKHPADYKILKINNVPALNLPSPDKIKIETIGTANPTSDFETLKSQGKTIKDLASEMTKTIETLFHFNLDSAYTKALDTLKYFRQECTNSTDPSHYNDWMKQFKQSLSTGNKADLISTINENNLSYITKTENAASTYSEDSGDSQLYENDTIQDSSQITVQSEVNDLFDAL